MVFNATFINISVISRRSVLLVEETGGPGENHQPVASHRQTLFVNFRTFWTWELIPYLCTWIYFTDISHTSRTRRDVPLSISRFNTHIRLSIARLSTCPICERNRPTLLPIKTRSSLKLNFIYNINCWKI